MASLHHLSLLLAAGVAGAVEFQRAGYEAAAHRWSTWSSIPGSFLSLPQGAATEAQSQMLDLGQCLGLYICHDGDGRTFPKVGDTLTMHYIGRLSKDDTQFDSSRDRGTPFTFTIGEGEVIKGWDEGVMKMSVGERGILQVPAAKGYGARGAGGKIPPNADLYFDVELLAINGEPDKSDKKLPEQGYSGKKVEHKNMETCTDDWRREYGPKAGKEGSCTKDKKKAPAPKPDAKREKSGSVSRFTLSLASLAVAVIAFY